MANYNFKLVHWPGSTNHTNHLSWWSDYNSRSHDNEDIIALLDKLFVNVAAFANIDDDILEVQQQNWKEMKWLQKQYPIDIINEQYSHMNWPVVPSDTTLQ